jgi:MSHA biogenesis protein MshN
MSVINQMLKDLEKRRPEPINRQVSVNQSMAVYSPVKTVFITAILVLLLCGLGLYVWQLNNENALLKTNTPVVTENVNEAEQLLTETHKQSSKLTESANQDEPNTANNAALPQKIMQAEIQTKPVTNKIVANALVKVTPHANVAEQAAYTIKLTSDEVNEQPTIIASNTNTDEHLASKRHDKLNDKVQTNASGKSPRTSMKVSRRQLSADELAEQKLRLVEKALLANDVDKAEKLLEDVVIIKPKDSQTRRKLAALWFSRQANQDALNLLSQGIALNPEDANLRIMKARMYLEQKQLNLALNTLTPLAGLQNEQYQIMLANTAQAGQKNNIALASYQVLIDMQPNKGKWPLAIAVLYDKNSEFTQAKHFYQTALTKNDLSSASENFIKQRIQVIGQ